MVTDHDLQGLWQFFADSFPNRWLNAVGDWDEANPAVRSWRFHVRDLTREQLNNGTRRVVQAALAWPPSASEFRGYCLEPVGVPDLDEAYREAVRAARASGQYWAAHVWSHDAVYAAAHSVGTWNLQACSEAFLRKIFANAYSLACERWRRGECMRAPQPQLLTHDKPKRADPAKAAPYIAQLREHFNQLEEAEADERRRHDEREAAAAAAAAGSERRPDASDAGSAAGGANHAAQPPAD